jgi:hypothetical protein
MSMCPRCLRLSWAASSAHRSAHAASVAGKPVAPSVRMRALCPRRLHNWRRGRPAHPEQGLSGRSSNVL